MLNTMHLSLLPPKASSRKTLVLDLDETLVHSDFTPFTCPSNIVFPIEFENVLHDIHVLIRPGVSKFKKKMSFKRQGITKSLSLKQNDIFKKQQVHAYKTWMNHVNKNK